MLIICCVFDVLALSEVLQVRRGKKRGEETRRERTEQKKKEKQKKSKPIQDTGGPSQNGNSRVTAPRPPLCYFL